MTLPRHHKLTPEERKPNSFAEFVQQNAQRNPVRLGSAPVTSQPQLREFEMGYVNDDTLDFLYIQLNGKTYKWALTETEAIVTPEPEEDNDTGDLLSVQVFTSSGTWTRPEGINAAKVIVIGGGGGGASARFGGAGGGCAIKWIFSGLGATENITIGAAGSGGTSGGEGGDGGTSSFGSHCSASGGQGGRTTDSAPGTGTNGDINLSGQPGSDFQSATLNINGRGGNAPLGYGHGGVVDIDATTEYAGKAATGYGAGGSSSTISSEAGGAGTSGIIIIEEYKR